MCWMSYNESGYVPTGHSVVFTLFITDKHHTLWHRSAEIQCWGHYVFTSSKSPCGWLAKILKGAGQTITHPAGWLLDRQAGLTYYMVGDCTYLAYSSLACQLEIWNTSRRATYVWVQAYLLMICLETDWPGPCLSWLHKLHEHHLLAQLLFYLPGPTVPLS